MKTSYWSDNVVAYEISPTVKSESVRSGIEKAVSAYNSLTCLQWKKRTTETDYVVFVSKQGCYSFVGRVGGRQEVSLSEGCGAVGVVEHEMAHVLGLLHEQSRPDRDKYVFIEAGAIIPGVIRNFDKFESSMANTLHMAYDYGSMMHYSRKAFSRDGRDTIVTIDPKAQDVIGQRSGFSECDLEKINTLYGCTDKVQRHADCLNLTAPDPPPCNTYSGPKDKFHRMFKTEFLVGDDHLFFNEENMAQRGGAEALGYKYQGVVGLVGLSGADLECNCLQRLYRMYHRFNVDHFYTVSEVQVEEAEEMGYRVEEEFYYCVRGAKCGATLPLYRTWYLLGRDHKYTTSYAEYREWGTQFLHYSEGIECYLWSADSQLPPTT